MQKKLIHSVKKALDVLDILAFDDLNQDGVPLSELSRRTGVPSNTLHGILATLTACGYVRQKPDTRYFSGTKIDDIGRQNLIRRKLAEAIPELMDAYREKTGESIVFYALINARKIPVHSVNRKGLFSMNFDHLRQAEFFSVPTSRVIFAFASPEDRNAIIDRWGMPAQAWNNIQSEQELQQACQAIRKRGFDEAVSHQGQLYSIAFPVIDKNNHSFGAAGLYAPLSECTVERKKTFKAAMEELVDRINDLL